MAEENEDGQEKTEEPSQRKIEKAKEDGKVLSSKEMFVFTNIAMGLILMFAFFLVARQYLFEWADLFVFDSDTKLDDLPSIKTNYALWYFLKVSLFFGTPVFSSFQMSLVLQARCSRHSISRIGHISSTFLK